MQEERRKLAAIVIQRNYQLYRARLVKVLNMEKSLAVDEIPSNVEDQRPMQGATTKRLENR